jgi:hypothetical protein
MTMTESTDRTEVPLLSKAEAIAEVRRWLEAERVDPEGIFTASAEGTIRYKDLIGHLERETPDGRLLLLAISRGRLITQERRAMGQRVLQIAPGPASPPDPPGEGRD